MIQLRLYQQTLSDNIRKALATNKRVLASCVTGGGKTKIFITIAKGAIAKNRTVLIVTESKSIYTQIHNEIGNTINIGDGIKDFYIEPNTIYVAMAQTLSKRPGLIDQFNKLGDKLLIINDEAHINVATKLLLQLKDAYLIGFTGTPNFKDANHLPDVYQTLVVGPQAAELVDLGYLSPYYHFERQVVDLSKLKKGSKGDYSEQSQGIAFNKDEVISNIISDLKAFEFHKCMIYCSSINHCQSVVEKLRALNYNVSECHSKNKDNDYEMFQFTNGINNICVSVGAYVKGWDFPELDLIILNRCTSSLSLFNQLAGRGSRLSPKTGKNKFTIIDYGRHATRHKPWNYEHPWEDMWNKPLKDKGVAPIKICKGCGYMMPVNVNPCPECGIVTVHIPNEKEVKQTELIEITEKYNSLRGRNISTLTPKELNDYVKMTNKKLFAQRIARAKGYDYLSQYAVFAKWKYGWQNHYIADTSLNYADIVLR